MISVGRVERAEFNAENRMYKGVELFRWGTSKGIFDNGGDAVAQLKKTAEEVVEAVEAICLEGDLPRPSQNVESELGDIYVTWIMACECLGVFPEDCIDVAFAKIMKRKGRMINNQFVKEGKDNE